MSYRPCFFVWWLPGIGHSRRGGTGFAGLTRRHVTAFHGGEAAMKRRQILTSGLALAGAAVAAPAIAQTQPSIRWRLTSSFPKSLETIYGGGEFFAERVNKLTDGKFTIRVFAAGDIVPAFQALDAVQQGTVEMCHTASYYYVGKDFTMGFGTALPFGLTTRQQNAWMYHGGGIDTMNEFFKDYGVIAFPAGNTGAQMGGWFRNPVNVLDDFKGLKMRIPGLGGQVMARIGAVPQALPGGDIYPAWSAVQSTRSNGWARTTTNGSASTRSSNSTIT